MVHRQQTYSLELKRTFDEPPERDGRDHDGATNHHNRAIPACPPNEIENREDSSHDRDLSQFDPNVKSEQHFGELDGAERQDAHDGCETHPME